MIGRRSDAQDTFSFESCSSSMACDMEEVSSECLKRLQYKEETMSVASWTTVTKGKRKRGVEAGAETPEAMSGEGGDGRLRES